MSPARCRLALLALLSAAIPPAALAQTPAHPSDSGVSVDMGALDALPAAPKHPKTPTAKKPAAKTPAAHAPAGTAAGKKHATAHPAKKPSHPATAHPDKTSHATAATAAVKPPPTAQPQPAAKKPAAPAVTAPAATAAPTAAPPPAPAKTVVPVSLPADHPAGPRRMAFAPGQEQVPTEGQSILDALAGQLAESSQRVQIVAHASMVDADADTARRISLARAQAVRAYLIGKGVRGVRMDVVALGNREESSPQGDSGAPADRVDLVVTGR